MKSIWGALFLEQMDSPKIGDCGNGLMAGWARPNRLTSATLGLGTPLSVCRSLPDKRTGVGTVIGRCSHPVVTLQGRRNEHPGFSLPTL